MLWSNNVALQAKGHSADIDGVVYKYKYKIQIQNVYSRSYHIQVKWKTKNYIIHETQYNNLYKR